ncbi:amylo-alpha-1,6-glucosidase [Neosynechococcus sphagnicola]|uniref:amylo-alpha-1,6-glucosidase n=1 Tax=Neosynechococcus sphagnicola TaxID=1501145 RepID=UPI000AA22EB0|nr:amylo-alpha-1,6-glucosidase [Neosynechococcus sphagnicola]
MVSFGREICGELGIAETREWLVTNGIGGFASGTIAGLLTRRYHGLLMAALTPPLGRTLLLSQLDETAQYGEQCYPLSTNRWAGGGISPDGYRQIERFFLEGTIPVWHLACADALLEKRIWMQQGANTTYIHYQLRRGTQPLHLTLKAMVNYRDYHGSTHGDTWHMAVNPVPQGQQIIAFPGAAPLYLLSAEAEVTPAHTWYRNYDRVMERQRGLDAQEDHLHAATFQVTLHPGDVVTVVASTQSQPSLDGSAMLKAQQAYEQGLLNRWHQTLGGITASEWVNQLVLAADQFIVSRPQPDRSEGQSVIAGYHWFGDWGRDTMISLTGLTLTTGRPVVARSILRTFAQYVDQGMLPNRFPDAGEVPEYNTVDATLWYFEAIRAYHQATHDQQLLQELFPVLAEIVDWHCQGTRYHIQLDPTDGLLYAGEPGVQLTWMDAKVGEWVVTPRMGKPIEINALWYNALRTMEAFAQELGLPGDRYQQLGDRALTGFGRFWNPTTQYCYDVLDGSTGHDPALRPNQILAVALESPLTVNQQRQVVDVCGQTLLTSHGLRSLAANEPQYQGVYQGNSQQRDAAYHQGTVWGWLLGPFVQAHLKVYADPFLARTFLEPMANQLWSHGIGSLSEIFDGDVPLRPRGCIAQAWTVAEVLRAWRLTASQLTPKG